MRIILLIYFCFFSAFLFSQKSDSLVEHVNAKKFKDLIESGQGILLDVRTIMEYNNYHITNSEQMNFYDPDFREKILKYPKDTSIYIYCNVGHRSSLASQILVSNGYTKVYNLHRGILEWHNAGYPLVANQQAAQQSENAISPEQFTQIVNTEELVFFDFYAPWCAPCRMMMPMIDSLTKEYLGKVNIIKINTDASRSLMQQLNVRSIPFLVLFRKQEAVFMHTGMITRDELEKVFLENISTLEE
jgi:thioredoxin 1